MRLSADSSMGCRRVKLMYGHRNDKNGEAAPLVSEALYNIVMAVRLCTWFTPHVTRRCGACCVVATLHTAKLHEGLARLWSLLVTELRAA